MDSKEQILVNSCIVILMPLFEVTGSRAVLVVQGAVGWSAIEIQ